MALGILAATAGSASAETIEGALAKAYRTNPTLNANRAALRAVDENVPRALAGYRPRVTGTADIGANYTEASNNGQSARVATAPRGAGVEVTQTLFNGNRTFNTIRQAESQVFNGRFQLYSVVQDVLFQAAQVYMNVLRDTAALTLQRNNVEVIEEQLRQTRDRFNVGEVTRTDVAQAEARLALARSQVSAAESTLRQRIAEYRRVVGAQPTQLAPGRPVDRLLPTNIETAIRVALSENPAITAAQHAVDVAELAVKVVEGELYPTLSVSAGVSQRYDTQASGDQRFNAQVVGRLSVPIYEGGEVFARVRQAKETVAQRRFELEVARDQVRANIISAWGQLEAAKAQIIAAQAQVEAAETALTGVREEARVGQRTTLDVLNSQQELLNARLILITAQRDRVIGSYLVAQALGRLGVERLALPVPTYDPKLHYELVKGKAWGTTTPSGD